MKWTACKPMLAACCALLASRLITEASPLILVPAHATWKYHADGSDPGSAWKGSNFNDSGWPSGTAQLGYGDGDEATVIDFGPDPLARHITTYFRKTFNAPPGLTEVTLRLIRDDGAVVYVNGVEVFRNNMPAGPISSTTLATVAVGGADESTFVEASVSPAAFVPGTNVIAVEVHQVTQTSSDLSFALELLANSPQPGPLVQVEAVDPEAREISPLLDIPEDPAVFRLTRTGSTETLAGVFLRLSGSASNGLDYARVTNFVIIPTGSSSTDIVISVLDDELFEGTETVVATIVPSPCLECYTTGTNSTATAHILDDEPTNTPPTVVFAYPTNGSVFNTPTNILLQVEARDPEDGEQVAVEFYSGTTRLGTGTHVPAVCITTPCPNYLFEWTNPPPGNHTLTARVTDKAGATVASRPMQISVREAETGTNLVLIPAGSFWKYWDQGTDQGTAWRDPRFDDSTWATGLAQLGYGDGDEATVVSFGPDPSNKYVTTYFRRTFQISNAAAVSNLLVRLLRDDGAVIYLNGVEVFRSNMPGGPVTYQTLALSSVGGADETTEFYSAEINPALLVDGANVLAVELHQASPVSADISFDLELRARVGSRPPERTVVQVVAVDAQAQEVGLTTTVNPGRFAVRRMGNLSSAIKVSYNLGGTASNGVDYLLLSNSVVIPAGALQTFIDVIPKADGIPEGTETVVLTVEPPVCAAVAIPLPECYQVGTSNQATVFINDGPVVTNRAPSLVLIQPTNGAVYVAPTSITLQASAHDPENGSHVKVEFYAGTNRIGLGTFLPTACPAVSCPNYGLVWSNAPVGPHVLRARATDQAGASTWSAPAVVTVQSSEPPGAREWHAVGLYSGNFNGGSSVSNLQGKAWITVHRPGKRVSLFLSAYEPVLWHVTAVSNTVIEKIILGGYYEQDVTGISDQVEVIHKSYYQAGGFFSDYLYLGYSLDGYQFLRTMPRLCALTGLDLSSFQGDYTAPTNPFIIGQVQADPRLRCDYPQPVDLSTLPNLSFEVAFYNQAINLNVFKRQYTLGGPVNGGRLLPGMRMVADGGGRRYYGTGSGGVWVRDPEDGFERMELGPEVPELSWPTGIALDSQRNRVLLSSLGGEGYLYAYSLLTRTWSVLHSLQNRDVNGIAYHAADDSIYAVATSYESSGRELLRFNAAGAYQGQIPLPQMPFNFSPSEYETELVSVGEYLVLLLEPQGPLSTGTVRESRMYLIEPRTSGVWLTYRKALIADSDDDGVADGQDQCPGTPLGEPVNTNGCGASQSDSDQDGVPDSRDRCPGTPVGVLVNAWGCPAFPTCEPQSQWQLSLGGPGYERVTKVHQTPDGGYLIGGEDFGLSQMWVAKVSNAGSVVWQRHYGPSATHLEDLQPTADGGAIVAGSAMVGGTDARPYQAKLIRIDGSGNVIWERLYGGMDLDMFRRVQQTSDGGFIAIGSSWGPTGDGKSSPHFGDGDGWLVKVDASGNKQWERSFGGSKLDNGGTVWQTADGGYLVSVSSESPGDGNKGLAGFGGFDAWILKLSAGGDKVWERIYGTTNHDMLGIIDVLPNGSFLLAGEAGSSVSGNKTTPGFGGNDAWMLLVDASGNTVWERTIGGNSSDGIFGGERMPGGGHVLVGFSMSPPNGSKTSPKLGGSDYWLVRIDGAGTKLWERTLGGSNPNGSMGYDIAHTSDGGFIVAGESHNELGGDKTVAWQGSGDGWVVKLGPENNDCDGDGVPNSLDKCPKTMAGVEVNAQGCTIADLCPCEGPWRNRNDYVNCVRTTVEQFVAAGWMTRARGEEKVEAALDSNCGRRRPRLRIPPQAHGTIQNVGCHLVLEGEGPGVCVIECSNDLSQWRPISTNTLTGLDIPIMDAQASGAPKRFYRIREE